MWIAWMPLGRSHLESRMQLQSDCAWSWSHLKSLLIHVSGSGCWLSTGTSAWAISQVIVSTWLGLPHDVALGFWGWASRVWTSLLGLLHSQKWQSTTSTSPRIEEREPRSQLLMEERQRPKVRWPWGGIARGCHLWKIKSSTLIWNKQNNTHFIGLFKRLR